MAPLCPPRNGSQPTVEMMAEWQMLFRGDFRVNSLVSGIYSLKSSCCV